MKCTKCGAELIEGAKFCHICTAPVAAAPAAPQKSYAPRHSHFDDAPTTLLSPEERPDHLRYGGEAPAAPMQQDEPFTTVLSPEQRPDFKGYGGEAPAAPMQQDEPFTTVLSPEERPDFKGYAEKAPAARRQQAPAPRRSHFDDAPTTLLSPQERPDYNRYEEEGFGGRRAPASRPPRYQDDFGADDRRPYAPPRRRYQEPPKKKHTALIVSIIALVLVLAVAGGLVIYFTNFYVSAAEIREAQSVYLPPAQVFKIDTTLEDPSNENIKFEYDKRARIISCAYTVNKKAYEQTYTYDDNARKVTIDTSYKGHALYKKSIDYSRVTKAGTFEAVDGYYIRLDEASLNGSAPSPTAAAPKATAAPTAAPTQPPKPTAAPTEAPAGYKDLYINYLNTTDRSYTNGKLIYLNDDDIPELILYVGAGAQTRTYQLCWISEGTVQTDLFDTKGYVYKEYDGYLLKSIGNMWGGGWVRYVFDGSTLTEDKSGSYEVIKDTESGTQEAHYYVDGEETTEEEYSSARGGEEFWTPDDPTQWTEKSSLQSYIRNFG